MQVLEERTDEGTPFLTVMFDFLFVAGWATLSTKLMWTQSASALVDMLSHWLPLFFSWSHCESFATRLARASTVQGNAKTSAALVSSWALPLLTFFVAASVFGALLHLETCRMGSFTVNDVPYHCVGFALFVAVGRFWIALSWIAAAFGASSSSSRAYPSFKAFAALVPGLLYLLCAFIENTYTVLPILWFVGMGLDIVLNFAPSSFAWLDNTHPRSTRATEERYGMLYVAALTSVCVATLWREDQATTDFATDYLQRYAVVMLVLALAMLLGVWRFVVSETWDVEYSGGQHAIQGHWWRKDLWLVCEFVAVSGFLVMSFVSRRALELGMSQVDRISFGVCLSLAVWSGFLQLFVTTTSKASDRVLNKIIRLIIRFVIAACLLGVAFVPVTTLGDGRWLGILVALLSLGCVVEAIVRTRPATEAQVFNAGEAKDDNRWTGAYSLEVEEKK